MKKCPSLLSSDLQSFAVAFPTASKTREHILNIMVMIRKKEREL